MQELQENIVKAFASSILDVTKYSLHGKGIGAALYLTPKVVQGLINALPEWPDLIHVYLENITMSEHDCIALLNALQSCSKLQMLTIVMTQSSMMQFTHESKATAALVELLDACHTLTYVRVESIQGLNFTPPTTQCPRPTQLSYRLWRNDCWQLFKIFDPIQCNNEDVKREQIIDWLSLTRCDFIHGVIDYLNPVIWPSKHSISPGLRISKEYSLEEYLAIWHVAESDRAMLEDCVQILQVIKIGRAHV